MFAIVKQIVDAGGQFRSLAEPWADTAASTGRLMIAVLGGLVGILSAPARRTAASGLKHVASIWADRRSSRRSSRGKHGGGPAEGATLKELANSYNVGRATISSLAA